MPDLGVAITKQTKWHGVQEQFDNVYYFNGPLVDADPSRYRALVDAIVAAEKPVHGQNVEFMTARVWTAGGTIIQNVTKGLYDLDGFGTGGTAPTFKEMAVLVEWECDRANVLGRKVYLRKFIRPCANPSGALTPMLVGEDPLGSTTKAAFKSYADAVQNIVVSDGTTSLQYQLCSPSDRVPRSGANGVVNNYVISREFRRN